MHLDNQTPWPALLQQADFGTATRFAVVIWKATYQRWPDGTLTPAPDPMPITGDPVETPYGVLNGDIFLRKQGADLCVLGTLRRSRRLREEKISISCGDFRHSLRVHGDRTWTAVQRGDDLVPSAPAPFDEMELSYRRAFGGVTTSEGLNAAHTDNPVGRGYYLSRDEATGKVLPNIETVTAPPIRSWKDQPAPAGWAPYFMSWGLRAKASVALDPATGTLLNVYPSVFNNANPELVLPQIAPGAPVAMEGARDAPWTFQVPAVLGTVRVQMGEVTFAVTTRIDGVLVWLDTERVVVTQRGNFKYIVTPRQVRVATLTVGDA